MGYTEHHKTFTGEDYCLSQQLIMPGAPLIRSFPKLKYYIMEDLCLLNLEGKKIKETSYAGEVNLTRVMDKKS